MNVADKMLLVARTTKKEDVQKKTDGISLFIVDAKESSDYAQPIKKVGTHCVQSDDCFYRELKSS